MAKNYYIILGIESDATLDEIKSAYRRKVQQYHPDHYGEDSEPFIEIQEAYSTLSDPARRKAYDDSLSRAPFRIPVHTQPRQRRSPEAAPLRPSQKGGRIGSQYGHPFDEVFEHLWSSFGNLRGSGIGRNNPIVEIPLSRAQAAQGGFVRVYIPARIECPTCMGFGDVAFWVCMRCNGSGVIEREYPLDIEYPPGIADAYAVRVPLHRYGLHPSAITVLFRIGN